MTQRDDALLKALPGNRTHLGATVTRRRGELRRLLDRRGGSPFASSTPRATRPVRVRRLRRGRVARLRPWHPAGTGLRLPGERAVRPGQRPALQPGQAAARPLRQGHPRRVTYDQALLGHDPADPPAEQADSAPYVPRSLVIDQPAYDWEGDTQLHRRSADSVIYEVHAKGFTAATRTSRRRFAAPTRAWRTRPRPGTCATSASPPWNCCRCTSTCPRGSSRPRPDQLLGLQHDRLLRPAPGLLGAGGGTDPTARSTSSRTWSRRCTGRASRSSSTWSTTTPRRATRTGPRSASAAWTTACTTGWRRATRASTTTPPAPGTR